jgi:RNA polymerase sigma-32 factor
MEVQMQANTETLSGGDKRYGRRRQLSAAEECDLIRQWRDEGVNRAGDILLRAFSPLVAKHALTFRHYGLPLDDLIQEGNLGLIHAAKGFDLDRGVRFSTYAIFWIRAQIQDFVLRNTSVVRMGATRDRKSLFFKLRHVQAEMGKGNRASRADSGEIAAMFNVSQGDVEQIDSALRKGDLPLNALHPATDQELLGMLADQRPDPEALAMEKDGRMAQTRWLMQAMSSLSERERLIIMSRRLSDTPEKLETLGRRLGVSPERVRQIEQKALGKMKVALTGAAEKISDFFLDSRHPGSLASSQVIPIQAGV